MSDASSFTWHENPGGVEMQIIQGAAPIKELLTEVIRQSIALARHQNRLPLEPVLPDDDELKPLLSHLHFYGDRTIFQKLPFDGCTVVDIDHFKGLPVKLALTARFHGPSGMSLLEYSPDVDGPITFHQRLFDLNHGQRSSLRVLSMAAIALDEKSSTTPNS